MRNEIFYYSKFILQIILFFIIITLHKSSISANENNWVGKELTVKSKIAIACFSTGWIDELIKCSKLGDWLKKCKDGQLEKELFKPISSAINEPRCIKLLNGDKVKVIDVDSPNTNYLWVESDINKSFNWWTLKQFFIDNS